MEMHVTLRFTIPEDQQRLLAFVEDCAGGRCVDEELLQPEDEALMPWYDFLLDYESVAFYHCDEWALAKGQALLGYMPGKPQRFAEAMLHLLTALGATDLNATIWTLDSDDGIQWQLHLAAGELVSQKVTVRAQ